MLTGSRFGGTNGTHWFSDVWSYDPKTVSWSQLDCIGYIPAAREGHSAALVGDVMYIFGGRTEEGTDLGDLAAFRITSRRWYTFQNMGPSPSARSGHSMTSYGKQIVVLAGEPSSAARDPSELSLVYVLDTAKIRYPNDQQIQQTPAGERVPGNRRPSQERAIGNTTSSPQQRPINGPGPAPESMRKYSGSRESIAGQPRGPGQMGQLMGPGAGPGPSSGPGPGLGPGGRGQGQDPHAMNGASPPGSRVPRASVGQAPPGPPPQQQAPPPRTNGVIPPGSGPRSRTPTRDGRGYGPPVDTTRGPVLDSESTSPPVVSPVVGARPSNDIRSMSPAVNGRHTPNQQATQSQPGSRFQGNLAEDDEQSRYDPQAPRSLSRQGPQGQSPMNDANQYPAPGQSQQRSVSSPHNAPNNMAMQNNFQRSDPSVPLPQYQQLQHQHQGLQSQHEGLQSEHQGLRNVHETLQGQQEQLQQELEAARSRNAWYASELALAKKSGYEPNASRNPSLDEAASQSFGDADKPLIEALVYMRSQLAEVRGTVSARENVAAQQLAEIEHQRDNAIREAVYAKAKLAAHGGSHAGTPQSEAMSRDLGDEDRSGDIARKLALALAAQNELRATIASMTSEVQNERRARELAEDTAEAAQRRAAEFESSRNPGELETLRAELHHTGKTAREEAAAKAEAHAKLQMLEVDKDNLSRSLGEALENTKQHSITLGSLREAVTSTTDKASHLERKLDDERQQRELVERKLTQLRSEHEERTAELDDTTRKLRDSEEMAATHAAEAQTHRQAVLAGLDKLNARGVSDKSPGVDDERTVILRQQVESAHGLVRKHQTDANDAADKLRKAEERIAGLEAYQEQSSRESLMIRKQLQDTVRESQALQARHATVQQQFETHQRDTGALHIKYNALKELLDDRGMSEAGRSRNVDSPGSRFDTPDNARVKDLEQQLEASLRAHQDTRDTQESREMETERTYREKLELLETDYQSAVHYVKGTEKMLKRMKDELTKYKKQNERLQADLDSANRSQSSRSLEPEAAAEWETERQALRSEINDMQRSVKETHSQLESQIAALQEELHSTSRERDLHRQTSEHAQQQLSTAQQARQELEALKNENSMLESRAMDAEQKVTMLLDQVGHSVANYRRQSQNLHHHGPTNGGHARNASAVSNASSANPGPLNFGGGSRGLGHSHSRSTDTDPASSFPAVPETGAGGHDNGSNRDNNAIDYLTDELDNLTSQFAETHRNYRLSNNFDTSAPPSATGPGNMSSRLADWRKRLDAEEAEKGMKSGGGQRGLRGAAGGETSSERGTEQERDSGVIRPSEKMPGGLGGLSDESDLDGESDGEGRGSRSYVI